MIGGSTRHAPRRLEPEDGRILHGAGQSSDAFADYVRAVAPHAPLVYMTYVGLKREMPAYFERLAAMLGAHPDLPLVPQVGLSMTTDGKPEERYEHRVVAGEFDGQIEQFCAGLKALNRPAFVRIGYEFNGRWNGYQPESFVAAWQRITRRLRAHALDNVATVWCYAPTGHDKDFLRFDPGDEFVDWWSVDLFDPREFTADDTERFMAEAKRRGFPVMIGECTPRFVGVLDGETSWRRWFAPLRDFLDRHPHCKAMCYIAWDWSRYPQWKDWGDARVWENAVVLQRWRELVAEPRFIHARR